MKLDSNQAWRTALEAIRANREVVAAIAGVFFVLPTLVVSLLFPSPEPPSGMPPKVMMAMMRDYWGTVAPWMIPVFLFQAVGTLALLQLFAHRARPTVGEALRTGATGVPSYLGVQLIFAFTLGLAAAVLVGASAALKSPALGALGLLAVVVVAIYTGTRLALAAPLVGIDGLRNPLTIIARSWAATRGNAGRIMLFLLLLVIAFSVAIMVVTAIVGVVLALVAGAETARVISAVLSSVLSGSMAAYIAGCLFGIHRQLVGTDPEIAARFE